MIVRPAGVLIEELVVVRQPVTDSIDDLERICPLAPDACPSRPVRYQRLVNLLGVDTRTLTASYLLESVAFSPLFC